uniref:Ig-like domain-containing protein n=1 Tax=Panagrellus redivivus TaxID=6233 RepID=A0A7E4VJ05_PANRE
MADHNQEGRQDGVLQPLPPLIMPDSDNQAPPSGIATNRETVVRHVTPDGKTREQTHLVRHEGAQDLFFTEEHWSSEIKSFVAFTPPKFKQVIKAYRVSQTDRLTLVVEVDSEPPALFEWFCNDRPVALDRARFHVRTNLNITTLTVDSPAEGVYSCAARNPAGTSKSYGYIAVIDEATRQKLLNSTETLQTNTLSITQYGGVLARPPKFTSQVPHLTLKPGAEAILDVEVDSTSPVKFIWYVNGRRVTPSSPNVDFYEPSGTRSIVQFKLPEAGQYTVVAQNEYGIAKSSAFLEIEKDSNVSSHLHLLSQQSYRPAAPPAATRTRGASSTQPFPISTGSTTQRSSSVPRTRSPESAANTRTLAPRSYETESFVEIDSHTITKFAKPPSPSPNDSRFTPQPPAFINQLPAEITVTPNDKLTLTAEVVAAPPAEIKWNVNGFEIRKSKNYSLENVHNKSTLVVHPPVKLGRYNATARNELGIITMGTTVHPPTAVLPEFVESAIVASSLEAGDDSSDESQATVRMNDSGNETEERANAQGRPFPRKPTLLGKPASEVMVPKNYPLVLDFEVAAYPEAKIAWFLNNFELKPTNQISILKVAPNHSRLIVKNPGDGLYRAQATNNLGTIAYETRVFTEVNPVNERLIFTRRPSPDRTVPIYKLRRTAHKNQRDDLPKAPKIVTGFAPTHRVKVSEPLVLDVEAEAIPEANFQWRVNNFEVKPNKSVKIERVDENRSRIVFLQPTEGRYEVIAQNYLGKDSLSTKVIVDYAFGDDNRFPVFVDALPATTILAADTLDQVMVVVVRTSEPGSFRWFADGGELESNNGHEILCEPFKSTLIIRCAVKNNTEYAVEFTNSLGIIHSKTTVMTSPKRRPKTPQEPRPPRFVELLSSTAIAQGEVLEARVTLGEDTLPCAFDWYLKGEKIVPELVESTDFESVVRIPDASQDMSGLLVAIAKNELGQAESSMHFIVVDGAGEKQIKIIQDQMISTPQDIEEEPVEEPAPVAEVEVEAAVDFDFSKAPQQQDFTIEAPTPIVEDQVIENIENIPTEAEVTDIEPDSATIAAANVIAESITNSLLSFAFPKQPEPEKPATAPDSLESSPEAPEIKVTNTSEDFSKTTNITKREGLTAFVETITCITHPGIPESYSLLVKVAETLAQSLVAKIIVEAMDEAAHELATAYNTSESETDEDGKPIISPSITLAPTFEISKETYNITSGENVTIHTRVLGAPCQTVEWYKDGEHVEEDDHISIITTDGHTQLVMKNVDKPRGGTYECRATNPYGCAAYQCTIHVTDPDGQVPGPYITDVTMQEPKSADANVASVLAHIEVNRKDDYSIQEVIVEHFPVEFVEASAKSKLSGRRRSRDEKKKKRLSMESMLSEGSEVDRLETIEEPPDDGHGFRDLTTPIPPIDEAPPAAIGEPVAEAPIETQEIAQQQPPEVEAKRESEAVEKPVEAVLDVEKQQQQPELGARAEQQQIDVEAEPVVEQQQSEVSVKTNLEAKAHQEEPTVKEQLKVEPEHEQQQKVEEVSEKQQLAEPEQPTEQQKVEEVAPLTEQELPVTAEPVVEQQQLQTPVETAVAPETPQEQPEQQEPNVETEISEKQQLAASVPPSEQQKPEEPTLLAEQQQPESPTIKIKQLTPIKDLPDVTIEQQQGDINVEVELQLEQPKIETEETAIKEQEPTEPEQQKPEPTSETEQQAEVIIAKLTPIEDLPAVTAEVEATTEAVPETEQIPQPDQQNPIESPEPSEEQLIALLAAQSTDLEPIQQESPSPTSALDSLEDQLKKLQKDIDQSLPQEMTSDFGAIEEEEETFDFVSKQDVKLSGEGPEAVVEGTIPQSPTASASMQFGIPEISITDESGEEFAHVDEVYVESPVINVEVTRKPIHFTYHLKIVEPQFFVVSADVVGVAINNQKIVVVNEELAKLPNDNNVEVRLKSPALTKENVVYTWIQKKETGDDEISETWVLNRLEEPTSPTSPEATTTTNVEATYIGSTHSVAQISLFEPSKLLSEVLSEIPKSLTQSTTTEQPYFTAREDHTVTEEKTAEGADVTLPDDNEETPSFTEATSMSEMNSPPSFRQDIADSVFTVGEPAQLKAIVIGNPQPEVKWFVDGDEIHADKDYEIVYEDGVSVLRLRHVYAEDEGEYVCEAFNVAGRSASKCYVKVQDTVRTTDAHPEHQMPISDSFFFRKIKRLHHSLPRNAPSPTPLKKTQSSTKAAADIPNVVRTYTTEDGVEVSLTENFVIYKYLETDYADIAIQIKADFSSVFLNASVWPLGADIMNWSTPTASTDVETIVAGGDAFHIEEDNRRFSRNSDWEPTSEITLLPGNTRVAALTEKTLFPGSEVSESEKMARTTEYIESICDINAIFNDLNDHMKAATLPTKANRVVDERIEAPLPAVKLYHTQSFDKSVEDAPPVGFMRSLTIPAAPESGRRTPLLMKSSNWRCQSAKVVDITEEWIISKDEESLEAHGFFCPVRDLTPVPPEGYSPVPDHYEPPQQLQYSRSPPRRPSPKKQLSPEDVQLLQDTVDEVTSDAEEARKQYQSDMDDDAIEIERVILEMSEQLAQAAPVSKAQAEANEELLRTRLAEMILNIPHGHAPSPSKHNPAENYELIKEPINLLRNKLSKLEEHLIFDEEASIREELARIDRERKERSSKAPPDVERKEKLLRRRSENLARMTPLIHVVKNKLTTLEDVVDDTEEKTAARASGKATPASDRKTIHELLLRINSEINNIHDFCKRSHHIDSLNTVVDVLSKVCTHLDAILDTLRQWQEIPLLPKLEHVQHVSPVAASSPNRDSLPAVDNHATINIDLKKDEEHEMTNTFVMFTSGSHDKPTIGTSTSATLSKAEEHLSTSFTHVHAGSIITIPERISAFFQWRPTPKPRLIYTQKQESMDRSMPTVAAPSSAQTAIVEVPYIHLTAPTCQPSSSDTNMEVSIHLRRRGDHQTAVVLLPQKNVNTRLRQFMTGDTNSIQMFCEESDAGNDTDTTSAFFCGGVKTFLPNLIEEESSDVMSYLSYDSPLSRAKFTGSWKAIPGELSRGPSPSNCLVIPTHREQFAESTNASDDESSFFEVTNVRNSLNENFELSRKRRNYKVNAVLFPEQRVATEVTFMQDQVDVDVEKVSEKDRDSVVMLEEAYHQDAVRLKEAPINDEFDRDATPTPWDGGDHLETASSISARTNKTAELSVSVNAKSVADKVYVHLEEIPWGEVAMTIPENASSLNDDEISARSSILFNVIVAENQDEAKSQKSDAVSHRSSQKSIATSATASQPSLNFPTYVIKHSSTASITCELNNYVNRESDIVWYKGKEPVPKIRGKFDRISHDLLEVLVVNKIDYSDSELYSIMVNGELYPVAYLIVEPSVSESENKLEDNKFKTASSTMFVMEGQQTTISCQLKDNTSDVVWYKDQEPLVESHRIHTEVTEDGTHNVIIEDVDLSDQGTYYAYSDDYSIYVTLVVEEKIDEKEVVVSGPDTDDEDLNDYIVPPGSTATIACELESTEFLRDLVWQRNNSDLPLSSDKLEHVINGNKHYLIIHNAQPEDSGVYSVRINDTQFKVAQITITEGTQSLGGSRLKRISNNSLISTRSRE